MTSKPIKKAADEPRLRPARVDLGNPCLRSTAGRRQAGAASGAPPTFAGDPPLGGPKNASHGGLPASLPLRNPWINPQRLSTVRKTITIRHQFSNSLYFCLLSSQVPVRRLTTLAPDALPSVGCPRPLRSLGAGEAHR